MTKFKIRIPDDTELRARLVQEYEHAMAASDYAVNVISLLYPDRTEAIRNERLQQIQCLQEVKREIQ